ncbi:PREDICTED: zinc finger [Prunus dulcis]|uniref:PREDICTED: zinc finger n=1 Tax=Prunus dulcis TaxID=3755 RepID=A0A5E4G3Y6_PRUDU|nr:PREDICTED: zinc finger [Prunus dulcis]
MQGVQQSFLADQPPFRWQTLLVDFSSTNFGRQSLLSKNFAGMKKWPISLALLLVRINRGVRLASIFEPDVSTSITNYPKGVNGMPFFELTPVFLVQYEVTGIWSKDTNKIKLVQFAWCEVCKVNCNSNDTYIKHLVGKKHQKNLEQLEKLKNDGSASTSNVPSAATNAIIGPMKNP